MSWLKAINYLSSSKSRMPLSIHLFQRLISTLYLAHQQYLIKTRRVPLKHFSQSPNRFAKKRALPTIHAGTMIPPTITTSPGTSADSSDLEDNSPSPLLVTPRKSCPNKSDLSRPKFNFSFDSEHPLPGKPSKGSSRRQAASHRRFATPILRASAPSSKPKYYNGMGPVSKNACSDQNERLTIDTTAARRRSSSEESGPRNSDGTEPLPQDQLRQGYNCIDSIGSETGDIIKGIVSHLGGLALR